MTLNLNLVGAAAAVAVLGAIFYFGQASKQAHPPTPKVVVHTVESGGVVFHRVEKGGTKGSETECASVKQFVDGKSPAEVQALATQYGVSVAVLSTYLVCTP